MWGKENLEVMFNEKGSVVLTKSTCCSLGRAMSDFNDSLNDVSSDSFWEVGNYKRAVKRVDDGHRLCNDLMSCLHERAKIEKAYAAQLSDWAKRWRQLVEKGPQYGTLEQAWCSLMTEAEKVSDLHLDIRAALMAEDFEKVKNWQKEAYHKQMIGGFKETKEADDGFRKAQKPWAKKLKEVDGMKKNYHAACKEEKLATSRESSGKLENNNPEVQKKLQEKVEKCQQDVEKSKERYDKSLDELEKLTPQYMENMEQVFEQWQEFEDKRLVFFRELLLDVKQHLDLSTNHAFMSVYRTLEASIKGADPHEDLRWFRSTHGPGMCMNWPQFEEWSVDLNRTLSRRDTRRKHTDEVTLTAISQSRDSVQKSSPSAAAGAEPAVCLNPFDEDEDEEETPVERRESSPVNVNAEEVVSQTVAHLDVSDEDAANPFTSANGNPFEGRSTPEVSVRVQALYDYEGQEQDELSFRAGDEFLKTGEEDEQGWCKGRLANGTVGLYPANYVRNV